MVAVSLDQEKVAASEATPLQDRDVSSGAETGANAQVADENRHLLDVAIIIFFGIVEGYIMSLSGIQSPHFFRTQMTFDSFAILKFFLGCVGFSMIAQSLLRMVVGPSKFDATRMYVVYAIPYRRSALGCFILGIGMYIAGTGPTMIPAQMGFAIASWPFILLGALLGGIVFGITEPMLGLTNSPRGDARDTSLDGWLGVKYETIAVPAGIVLIGAGYVLERIFPHGAEASRFGVATLMTSPLWCSAAVGFNQIPLRIIKKTGQGGSTAVMNIVSTLSCGLISPSHKIAKIPQAYQLVFVYVGLGLGAWICYSREDFVPPEGYSPMPSVVGSFLTIYGARFAGGCTCGHGITGTSELSFASMLGAVSIFAGGIVAGILDSSKAVSE